MSDDGLELAEADLLTDEQVEIYLAANPDFFCTRDDLLGQLKIPHKRGDTISLVERQVALLRERNESLRERLNDLLSIARDNDRLFERTKRLVLAVMEAETLDEITDAVEDSLSHDFAIDYVSQVLIADSPISSRLPCHSKEVVGSKIGMDEFLESNHAMGGKLRDRELKFLFPENYKMVHSAAVVPLYFNGALGLLAVGSRKEDDFRVGSGTLFLSFIAEVVARALDPLMPARTDETTDQS
ncbi:DUF484 family protein [Sansalvadorimonas sp. 2012CJ34-2]|uniref:DUF484 family protein n=1 Tax=Parendozoicomonas callyspongiae TaxID=2942213 RepID=A0ABT0PLA7_9GAMM|nr:DUF484 family protein [Sansalvadorimonas sp. 2012CJ34-2]MCL6272164.1 DUF484 family protein [Sansalvadorimonas sp. 2012CJ34-2]